MYTRNEKIIPIYIEDEMKDSYISYAMSVIVGRALPEVRDGLKPVHRRILYGMKDLHLEHNKPYKKCARITGEILGKYHPHGDTAVYDSLVRMAQDFSLRYPLVDGQGNFGCFTKDTKIRLTDGRSLSFGQLIKETRKGKKNYTYTYNNKTGKIAIAKIKKPRLTKKKAKIVKIILDNSEEIKCTHNHLFMLRDGSYKEARDLKPQDSLMPLYAQGYDGKNDMSLKDYEIIYQPRQNNWEFTHHIADEWNINNNVYKRKAGRIRHHRDFNKLNNNPDNIQRIQWREHWGFHKEIASLRHKNDPAYVRKIAEGRKRFWSKRDNIERVSKRISKLNKKRWRDPLYRKKMSELRKELWKNPEYRQIRIEASSRNLKKLWKRKDFKELLSKLKSKELKRKWRDKKYRFFIGNITRQTSLKIWSNPKHRELMSKLGKQRWQNSKYRNRMVNQARKQWQNPEYRARYSPDHFSKMAKKLWEDPATIELHRAKNIRQWQDPAFRRKISNCTRKRNIKRLEENPNFMNELAQKSAVSLRKKWQNPLYKERVIKGKVLSYVSGLLKMNRKITPGIYEKNRTNNGVPNIQNTLHYFSNFQDMVNQAKGKRNHKVKAVKFLTKREDVYDLTINETHNFALASGVFVHNSVDGDRPAAMRYTEARMEHITDRMLQDLEKNTVKFVPNFDDSLKEPSVLPAILPNLLLNGSSGIAVGMTTNIPPHNLNETVDGIIHFIDNPDCQIKDLMKFIKGPDFPTGGIICGKEGIKNAYTTGRGKLIVHAKAHVEQEKNGKEKIAVTEIPYQVNKSNLLGSIANLVQNKKVEGISDLRDESDKDGMRIVIELKRGANSQVILNQLYKHTQMQETFGVIMLALVDARPRLLTLKEAISHYVEHRKDIIRRRTEFDLANAKARAHILEGLKIALKHLDAVIKTIRQSKTPPVAKEALMKKFKLSEKQAQAILEMQLQRLTGLERDKIDKEYLELIKKIELYEAILRSEKKVLSIITEELTDLKKRFGDERRTQIMGKVEEFEIEDLIAEEDMVITISHSGYIKRFPVSSYRKQKRGGKGVTGAGMKEEDFIEDLFIASTHDNILFFTDQGKARVIKVYDIPQAGRLAKGRPIVNLLSMASGEKITSSIPIKEFEEGKYLMMITKQGKIKKTDLSLFANVRRGGIIAIKIAKGDRLMDAKLTSGKDEVFIGTHEGKALRFSEKNVRDMGRGAAGVKGINLAAKDEVVGMAVIRDKNATLLTVTEGGFGKRTSVSEYRLQSRGGKGIINIKVTKKNGLVVGIKLVSDRDELMLITHSGMIVRCPIKDIRTTGRAAQGVRIIRLNAKDKVASTARVVKEEE